MSVASSNPFALLGDEGSPAPAPKTAAPKKADTPKPQREVPGAPKPRQAGRKGPAPAREESFAAAGNVASENRRPARGGEGRGRGRGGRGGRGGAAGRGRQFDRHSATAHNDSPKTVEQAWGGHDPKRELQAETDGKADAKAENAAPGTPAEPATPAEEAAPEPEDKELTLEEYLASLAEKKANIAAKPVRQVEAAPGSAKPLKKATEAEESYFAATNEKKNHKAKNSKNVEVVETGFVFSPPERPSRGRGGFGGARGGRGAPRGRGAGNGRGRGGRSNQGSRDQANANLNLGDSNAFPSLGA